MRKNKRIFWFLSSGSFFLTLFICVLLFLFVGHRAVLGFYMVGCIMNFLMHIGLKSKLNGNTIIKGSLLGPFLMFFQLGMLSFAWLNKEI